MSDAYLRKREFYESVVADKTATAGADPSGQLVADKLLHTLFVQLITASITTDAAQSWTFRDRNGTPVPVAVVKVSPGLGMVRFDFGAEGKAMTEEKGLDLLASAAGLAGVIHVEGYRKLTKVAAA